MTLSKDTLQQILDSVSSHTVIFQRTRFILANSLAQDWLAITKDDLNSISLNSLIHPGSRHTVVSLYKRLLEGEATVSARLLIIHPFYGNVWIDTTVKPANYFDDETCWIATFNPESNSRADNSDIQPEHDLSSPDADALSIENYVSINEFSDENPFIDTAMEDFLTTLRDIIPYDSASIAIIDEKRMHFIAARGFAKNMSLSDLEFEFDETPFKSTEILYENAYGKVQVIHDTTKHPAWVQVNGVNHIKAWLGIELKHENRVLGVLNIDSSTPHFFTRDHARHALALSGQAIIAITFTSLYKQLYNGYEEKRRLQGILVKNLISTETMYAAQQLLFSTDDVARYLPDLIDIVSSSMDDTSVIIIIFNTATGKLIHKLQSNTDDVSDIWAIFRHIVGEPALDEGTMPVHDLNIVAHSTNIIEQGKQVTAASIDRRGALLAVRDINGESFDETDHELIMTIARQISIALENERLNNQVKQQTQHLERLVERRTTQLSVERKRLKAILDSTAEGIFYMENFKIQYANPAFCRMVGYELEDLYDKPLSYIRVSPGNSEQHNFTSLLDNPLEVLPGRSETRLKHQDETEFYANIRFSLVGHPGEDPVRMVAIARDISQERKLYIQRARFIANAAHELRTPLSSLILRLHMLRRQPERMPVHLESLDKVTTYLKELVEELLTLSRFERGSIMLEKGEFIFQDLIQQAANEHLPFAEEQGVIVKLELPAENVHATVDGKRIHQMISNLIINGINYSAEGNTVSVNMAVEVDSVGNKNVIIHVIDEGAGIEADLLPDDIFEPFSRPSGGSRKETGMGLALVREIVSLHNGSVYAKSKLDEGATFRVSLPLN